MGHVVVELKIMEQDRVTGMVELEQVLECPRLLVVLGFNIMNINRLQVDGLV